MSEKLLEVQNLKKYFPVKGGILRRTVGHVKAVDDVSFYVRPGETMGIVGESGSGKSTMGRTINRLIHPTEGKIFFQGKDITDLSRKQLRSTRREIQMVFQDPYASLNPRMTVQELVEEPLIVHQLGFSKDERRDKVKELLEKVGLSEEAMSRYPHEFSGGQRQRIGIARALSIRPKLIIADEPVSALDVSIQSQVINLLMDLQSDFGLSYLFIAHDLSVVKHISDRIAVMYLGRMAEIAPKSSLYKNPLHPYTQALLSSIPSTDPDRRKERIVLKGELPSPQNPPIGCAFHPRCPQVHDKCRAVRPELLNIGQEHYVACHLYS
jgi:oligopeptide/dipeptide ABC transporter ATP-binding protein